MENNYSLKQIYMKKFVLLLVVFCAAQFANAQFLKVEKCNIRHGKHRVDNMFTKDEYYDRDYSTIKLSNGEELSILTDPYCSKWWWAVTPLGGNYPTKCECNLDPKVKYAKGTLVYKYKYGNISCYELVTMEMVGTYTIESCSICEVDADMDVKVDCSQKTFFESVAVIGGKKPSAGESDSAQIATKTIVNLVFTNGMATSIMAIDDPVWLEAMPGQKVEHYKARNVNIYKLAF